MPEKQAISQYFREVQPKFARLCASHLSRVELTLPQFNLLNILITEGAIPMTELSDRLHITKPAVTSLVDRLEQNKFIRRKAEPGDRRVHLIEVESKGRKFVKDMQTTILEILLKTLEQFTIKEKATIARFYQSLSLNMDEHFKRMKK